MQNAEKYKRRNMIKPFFICLIMIFISGEIYSQVPGSPLVHDPQNNLQLIQLGTTLEQMKKQTREILKTIESSKLVVSYSKARDFVALIEQSYCILKELDFYLDLSAEIGINNRYCLHQFKYDINVRAIANATWKTLMAIESTVMTLGEREAALTHAFNDLRVATTELGEMEEKVKLQYEVKTSYKNSYNNYQLYRGYDGSR